MRIRALFVATLAACALLAACTSVGPKVEGSQDNGSDDAVAIAPVDEVNTEDQVQIDIVDMSVPAPVPVHVRKYEPNATAASEPWATLIWAHGGSFVHGNLDWPEADWFSQRFAEAGVRVYSVDYRLATEQVKAPVPSSDVAAVVSWAATEHSGPIVVGGASAGGHLAAIAALAQAEARGASPEVRAANALILLYPTLHRVQQENLALAAATASLPEQRRFDAARIAAMYAYYLGGAIEGADQDPRAVVIGESPAEQLALLPPTVIVNADRDDLRASGEQFAAQLRDAGVAVTESIQPGTVHGYMNRPEGSDSALADANATIGVFIEELRGILEATVA